MKSKTETWSLPLNNQSNINRYEMSRYYTIYNTRIETPKKGTQVSDKSLIKCGICFIMLYAERNEKEDGKCFYCPTIS